MDALLLGVVTGEVLLTFSYGDFAQTNGAPRHLLTAVTDAFGNRTTIERGGDGTAQAINAYGTIVGWSLTRTGAQHAFMYANGVMTDLNSLNASGAQGWTMFEADSVNDEGQIVGRAANAQGQTEIFILTP